METSFSLEECRLDKIRKGFDDLLSLCIQSRAYAELCRRVYGRSLCQFNSTDMAQLLEMLSFLDLKPGEEVLDLGCGTGYLTEYIAECTKASVTGIDLAPRAIRSAQQRSRPKRERLNFLVGDMQDLKQIKQRFDAAIAVDSLQFLGDAGIKRLIRRLLSLLKPGGRMAFFYSEEFSDSTMKSRAAAKRTFLATALESHNLTFHALDLTQNEKDLWEKKVEALIDLKESFHSGEEILYQSLLREAAYYRDAARDGAIYRFLYQIQLTPSVKM